MTIQFSYLMKIEEAVDIQTSRPGTLEEVLNTFGNNTTTYTLSKKCQSVMVFVDGLLSTNFTGPDGTDTIVFGSSVADTKKVIAFSYNTDAVVKSTVVIPVLSVEGYPDTVSLTPTLTSSVFKYTGTGQVHLSTDWGIYQGTTLVWSSLNDTVNLTSVMVPELTLDESVEYVFRVRYKSNLGVYSEWSSVVASTVVPVLGWVSTLDGSNVFLGVSTDSSGNIYAVGDEVSSTGIYEALITKWSTDGSLLWQRRLGGSGGDYFKGVSIDSNDNIYAVGWETSSISNNPEALITKWSTDGSLLWQRRLGGSGVDYFQGVSTDSSGNIYAVGYDVSSSTIGEAFITKWSSTGSLLWRKRVIGASYDQFYGVSTDSSGNIYAVGYERSSTGKNQAFITKWSTDGSLLWQKRLGSGTSYSEFKAVFVDSNDNIYAAGNEYYSTSNNSEFLITKWSTTGSLIWQKRLGGGGEDYFFGVSTDPSGNVYAVGREKSSISNDEAIITKWSTDGSLLWQKRFGGSGGDDEFWSISIDSGGKVYAIGKSYNYRAFIINIDPDGNIPDGDLANHPLLFVNTTSFPYNTTTLSVGTTSFSTGSTTQSVNTTTLAVNDTTFTPVKSEY